MIERKRQEEGGDQNVRSFQVFQAELGFLSEAAGQGERRVVWTGRSGVLHAEGHEGTRFFKTGEVTNMVVERQPLGGE